MTSLMIGIVALDICEYILVAVVCYGVVRTCDWFEMRPWRDASTSHWTIRNAHWYSGKMARTINVVAVAANVTLVTFALAPGLVRWVSATAAFIGAWLGGQQVATGPKERERRPIRLKTVAAYSIMLVLEVTPIVGGIYLMPSRLGVRAIMVAAVCLLLRFAQVRGLSIRVMKLLGILKPAPERARLAVETVARKRGVPVRSVLQWDLAMANAWAFIATDEIAFSRKMLDACNDDEISTIAQHELSHLEESAGTRVSRHLGAFMPMPLIFVNVASGPPPSAIGFILIGIALLVLYYIPRRLVRRMEVNADGKATQSSDDPAVYARALEKLHVLNRLPVVLSSQGATTHPDLYDRLLRAGVTPEYPRPAPPRKVLITVIANVSIAALLVYWLHVTHRLG